jgi:hypothetical protein
MRTEANRMAAAALLTAMAGAFGCSSSPSDPIPPRAFTADEQGVSDASTSFGLDLFARVSAASAEPNVMVSPLSVSMALGMAANGANGETLDAIRSVLGFAGLDEASVNEAYRGLIEQLRARDPGIEFRLANSVWYQQGFPVLDPFLDAARTYFDAAVEPLGAGRARHDQRVGRERDQRPDQGSHQVDRCERSHVPRERGLLQGAMDDAVP